MADGVMKAVTRRTFSLGIAAAGLTAALGRANAWQVEQDLSHLTPPQREAYEAYQRRMWAAFPYEIITVRGADALTECERIKSRRMGQPVIVGGDQDLLDLVDQFTMMDPAVAPVPGMFEPVRTPDQILEAASKLSFPPVDNGQEEPAPVGEWPAEPDHSAGLSIAADTDGKPLDQLHILLVPATHCWEIPAYLRWGGWNANPAPEYHVAALRSWGDRFDAELVAINRDTMNVRVNRRPSTREEALILAREQYAYCPDLIDQGVGSVSALAAMLLADDWWYFWWD